MKYFRVTCCFECPACQAANRPEGGYTANNRNGAFLQSFRTARCSNCGCPLPKGTPFSSTIEEVRKAFHIGYAFVCAKCKKENRGEKILWAGDEAAARG